jgi:hypothetical protein
LVRISWNLSPSLPSVSGRVYPYIVARQRQGKNFTAATNSHETTEELLDTFFYQRKVGELSFPEFPVSSVLTYSRYDFMGVSPLKGKFLTTLFADINMPETSRKLLSNCAT